MTHHFRLHARSAASVLAVSITLQLALLLVLGTQFDLPKPAAALSFIMMQRPIQSSTVLAHPVSLSVLSCLLEYLIAGRRTLDKRLSILSSTSVRRRFLSTLETFGRRNVYVLVLVLLLGTVVECSVQQKARPVSLQQESLFAIFQPDFEWVNKLQHVFAADESTNPSSEKSELQTSNPIIKVKTTQTISLAEPFVSTRDIAQLTLGDITEVFKYTVESSMRDFNKARFLRNLPDRVNNVLSLLEKAVERSRGISVAESVVTAGSGDADALKFIAAMRILGEWRVLRQVPDGYRGYAVGMSLGHKDIVQNVEKVEKSIHGWIQQQSLIHSGPLRSPTLRELLEYEVEHGINPASQLPKVNDNTAGMGLLWVKRQLEYQTRIFDNVVQLHHGKFQSPKDAVNAAYHEVYDKYHGWAIQKVFSYSFQSAPGAAAIARHMNPHRLQEVLEEVERAGTPQERTPANAMATKGTSANKDGEQQHPVLRMVQHVGRNLRKVIPKKQSQSDELVGVRGGDTIQSSRSETFDREEYISSAMVEDAHHMIALYLQVVDPLLDDLSRLFDDLNMNDPTKV